MGFSAYKLNTLRNEVAQLESHKRFLADEIKNKQGQLEEVNKNLASVQQRFKELQQLLAQTAGNNPQAVQQKIEATIKPSMAELLPRVYIHISAESQRDTARQAAAALQQHAYLAPGIQNVGQYSPPHTELRYFRQVDLSEAQKIQAVLRSAGIDADLAPLHAIRLASTTTSL